MGTEMNPVGILFTLDVLANAILLFGVAWSIAVPSKRIWPPPSSGAWHRRLAWALFYLIFGLNAALLVLDWNTWRFSNPLRFVAGLPLCLIGALLVAWGIQTLGRKNTAGLPDGFVTAGPYCFTRNPQYLGDMLLFVGLSLAANSLYLGIAHLLTILVFLFTPWAEESWLEERYGEAYRAYRRETPRFF